MARGASQPRVAQEHPPFGPAAMETVVKAARDSAMEGSRLSKSKSRKKRVTAGMKPASYPGVQWRDDASIKHLIHTLIYILCMHMYCIFMYTCVSCTQLLL